MYFHRIYRQRIVWALLIPAATGLIFGFFALSETREWPPLLSFFRLFHFANDPENIAPMVLTAAPYLVLLCSLTGIFTDDLSIQTTYCFSRRKNVIRWYFSRIGALLFLSAVCVSVFFSVGSAVIVIAERRAFAEYDDCMDAILKMLFLTFLFVFGMGFAVNSASLLVKKKYIFPVTALIVFLFAAMISVAAKSENSFLMAINPMARINAELNCDILPQKFLDFIGDDGWGALGLTFGGSCVYFSAVSVFAFLSGLFIVKHTDIALKEED